MFYNMQLKKKKERNLPLSLLGQSEMFGKETVNYI